MMSAILCECIRAARIYIVRPARLENGPISENHASVANLSNARKFKRISESVYTSRECRMRSSIIENQYAA